MYRGFWWRKLSEKDNLKDLGVDERIAVVNMAGGSMVDPNNI
jgi:hypothetical protein